MPCYCQNPKTLFLVQAARAAVVAALPPGVDFVTSAWVPMCLQRGELLPAENHRIALVLLVLAERQDGRAAAAGNKTPSPSPGAAGLHSAGAGAGSAAGSAEGSRKGSTDAHAAPGGGRVGAPSDASAPPSKDAADTQGDGVRGPGWHREADGACRGVEKTLWRSTAYSIARRESCTQKLWTRMTSTLKHGCRELWAQGRLAQTGSAYPQ